MSLLCWLGIHDWVEAVHDYEDVEPGTFPLHWERAQRHACSHCLVIRGEGTQAYRGDDGLVHYPWNPRPTPPKRVTPEQPTDSVIRKGGIGEKETASNPPSNMEAGTTPPPRGVQKRPGYNPPPDGPTPEAPPVMEKPLAENPFGWDIDGGNVRQLGLPQPTAVLSLREFKRIMRWGDPGDTNAEKNKAEVLERISLEATICLTEARAGYAAHSGLLHFATGRPLTVVIDGMELTGIFDMHQDADGSYFLQGEVSRVSFSGPHLGFDVRPAEASA